MRVTWSRRLTVAVGVGAVVCLAFVVPLPAAPTRSTLTGEVFSAGAASNGGGAAATVVLLPGPYKFPYTVSEFWGEFTQGSLWKAYAKANPKESGALAELAGKKAAGEAYTVPLGLTRTRTGNALLMAVLTLPVS